MAGRLFVAAALEIAKDERRPKSFRQSLDLFMKRAFQLVVVSLETGFLPESRPGAFMPVSSGRGQSSTRRGPKGDLIKPRPQRIANPEPLAFWTSTKKVA